MSDHDGVEQVITMAWRAQGREIQFDEGDFHKRYLLRNGRAKDIETFQQSVRDLEPRLKGQDERQFINGEDFVTALGWFMRERKAGWRLKSSALRNALVTCVEYADLIGYAFFVELDRRLKSRGESPVPVSVPAE